MMKLFSQFAALMEDVKQPWYVAMRPEESAKNDIARIVKQSKIPNPHDKTQYHCTLIYSRQPCKEPQPDRKLKISVQPEKWEVFETRDGKRCLVLKLDSSMLQVRHKQLMKQLSASYDFPSYKPHITVSYDIGDLDITDIPLPKGPFNMVGEYSELLDDLD